MPRINFHLSDGSIHHVTTAIGSSVMDAAVDAGVPGIIAQCGGACICATCHCFIDSRWAGNIAGPNDDEQEMLGYLSQRTEHSRLACQVRINDALEDMIVYLPPNQE